jgi:hypothetical protein
MKKLIKTLVVVLILSFSLNAVSALAAPKTNEIKRTITKVYYMSSSGYYIAETDRDGSGGFWVLDVLSIGTMKENKDMTRLLKHQYIGKTVHIVYTGDEQNDEEIEIQDTWIE